MATRSATDGGSQYDDLLLKTSATFLQMMALARNLEDNPETRIFYSHIGSYCLRLQDHATRAPQGASQLNSEIVKQALDHLASLIRREVLGWLPSYASIASQLKMLNLAWDEARTQDKPRQLDFVRQWLSPELSEQRRHSVDKELEGCVDEFDKQKPEDPATKSSGKSLSPDLGEPSHAVWKAAQSLFDALLGCNGCSCPHQHDFQVKLELGTYRKPEEKVDRKPAAKLVRQRARKTRGGGDDVGQLGFDMFLSMERDWREIHVQMATDKGVSFQIQGEMASACITTAADGHAKVEKLCKAISAAKAKNLRLLLKLSSGHLFNMGLQKTNFEVDKTTEPISLAQCFENPGEFFTEKTKRILSLIVGYTVFHLHGTSWLQPGWGSANIKFFKTKTKTPMRPFIQTQLFNSHCTDPMSQLGVVSHGAEDDDTLDELYSEHKCPALVSLAVVLMEIYFTKPFKKLADEHHIELIDDPSGRIAPVDVDQVFYGDEESGKEEWRYHIPENYPLLEAIDSCLNSGFWEDEEGEALDNATLRSRIYQMVVRPLERHLDHGFGSQVPLDDVDQYARGLDFGHWGSIIFSQNSHSQTTALFPDVLTPERTPSPVFKAVVAPNRHAAPMYPEGFCKPMYPFSQIHNMARCREADVESLPSSQLCYNRFQFFDDERGDSEHHRHEAAKYLVWKSEYERVYEKFITPFLSNAPSVPVKVAVLDTGIDRDHYASEAREESIKGKRNFYNDAQKNVPDNHGHGTFIANLILDYAPDAALYIVKIADWENVTPDAKIVANAINHAVDKWDVDIISMSFGWPSSDFEGYEALQAAIDNAFSRKVLMFAAAANSGGRLGRAYPASDSKVICVHSTNANGNRSDFSPTASPYAINIATVGESIESAWPTLLCRDKANPKSVETRSGTSYATPIVAGIAAFQLQYARLHIPDSAALLKRKDKMEALLRRCAERGPNYMPRDGYYYVELSRHKHNLFGGELQEINYEVLKALKV